MAQLATDAVPSKLLPISNQTSSPEELNKKILRLIEHELDIEEKFSILFLMLDDFYCFNDLMAIYLQNGHSDIIIQHLKKISNWKDKFIEALCIINNQKIITSLGLLMKDLELIHYPFSSRIVSKINVGAKILYKCFESLGVKDQALLLNAIYKNIEKDERLKNVEILELHALYWISVGYITIKPNEGDMRQLLKCLKSLGHYEKIYYCDIDWYCSKLFKQIKIESTDSKNNLEQHVIIKKGLCLIINEMDFRLFDTEYENRKGSEKDEENLVHTFHGLNFEVHRFKDLEAEQIITKIKDFASKNDVYDCFAVCILSHGLLGKIVTIDNATILIDDIDKIMCTKEMKNTLKLLIIQACQGDTYGVHTDTDNHLTTDGVSYNYNLAFYKEYYCFSSTIKDHVSYRHKEEGSWFITDLCNVLKENKKSIISIEDWKREVIKRVQKRRGKLSDNNCAQLPEATDRLTKKFCFPPFKDF
ncbi:caspase-8 isoform X2 [Chelonus insularis]|uniref:caspase-8 isoform X2 n=1 Tax=Chelonus insularis TaxID=460826 RepID=UPI001589BA3C|nr:caspase-8 isoform X2 [Chelonus insularis]